MAGVWRLFAVQGRGLSSCIFDLLSSITTRSGGLAVCVFVVASDTEPFIICRIVPELKGNIMTLRKTLLAAAAGGILATAPIASIGHADSGIQLGQLACDVEGGIGFIFGSSKNLACTFTPANDRYATETYTGTIDKYGIDIGVTGETVILWTVVAAQEDKYAPHALAGTYSGATASAAIAVGLGANVLVGGSSEAFALQPVSVSGSSGINVAVGFAQIKLH